MTVLLFEMIAHWRRPTTFKDVVVKANDDDDDATTTHRALMSSIEFNRRVRRRVDRRNTFNDDDALTITTGGEKEEEIIIEEEEEEEKERAIVRLYKRNEPKRPGPFAVALTTEEKERIEEAFYVVEMVQKQKEEDDHDDEEDEDARRTATTWMDRSKRVLSRDDDENHHDEEKNTQHDDDDDDNKRRRKKTSKKKRSEKYIFVKTKDFELRELKDVDPEAYVKDSGCRYHEVRCARRFVCAEIACVDDEEKVSEEKCVKQRYAVRIGRVEDARAGSRMVCGSYVEVRMLDFVGGGKDAGDAKRKRTASILARSDADVENDRKKLIRVLEKLTATAEGILADERKENNRSAKGGGGENDNSSATETNAKKVTTTTTTTYGEFVDDTSKWTLLGENAAFDVHPAALYCAFAASVHAD